MSSSLNWSRNTLINREQREIIVQKEEQSIITFVNMTVIAGPDTVGPFLAPIQATKWPLEASEEQGGSIRQVQFI